MLVRAIPGFSGYFADSDGAIWSSHRGRWGSRYADPHRLKTKPDKNGYPCVRFWIGKTKTRNMRVHVIIALAFLGPKPAGLVVCHRNDDPTDNRPENLLYATHAENVRQAIERGRMVHGERSHLSKLTEEQAREIKRRLQAGESQAALAREFGIGVSALWALKTGRTWRHLTVISA